MLPRYRQHVAVNIYVDGNMLFIRASGVNAALHSDMIAILILIGLVT